MTACVPVQILFGFQACTQMIIMGAQKQISAVTILFY